MGENLNWTESNRERRLKMKLSYTMGGVIHVLLVVALIVVAVQFIQGRRRV